MKLQKLIIHNIASIEDATIDFNAKPLSDSEVFLITGKTGAGKSTILDAICLALYAKTPRFENTEMSGKVTDGPSLIGVDDERQLLRRNTGEGFVRLTFVGSNEVEYEAEWSVKRAWNRLNGNVQDKKWCITNFKTGKKYIREKDIEAEVAEAIGLDFNQFCRTTILAQGEFTKFLNSDDNSKAAILEKITGVDIYTKIGKKVFTLTSNHRKAYEESKLKLEGVKILTEEEVNEIKLKVKSLRAEADQMAAAKKVADSKLNWLKDEVKLKADIEKTKNNYEQALEKLESEDFKNKQSLINDWNATIEPRTYRSDILTAHNLEEEMHAKLDAGYEKFETLRSGLIWREDQVNQLTCEVKDLQAIVDADKANAEIYENAQTIESNLNIIITGNEKVADAKNKIGEYAVKLAGELDENKKMADKAAAEVNDKLAVATESLNAIEMVIKELNVTELHRKRDGLFKKKNIIEFALDKLKSLHTEEERIAVGRQSLEMVAKGNEVKSKQASALTEEYNAAEISTETCRKLYEAQLQTVNDWAKDVRRKLNVGDHCPVCGKVVDATLPDESKFAELLKQAEDAYNAEREKSESLRKRLDTLKAEINSGRETYEAGMKAISEDKTIDNIKSKVLEYCQQVGVTELNDSTATQLTNIKAQINASISELDKTIESANLKEGELINARKVIDQLRKEADAARDNQVKAEKAAEDCRNEIKANSKFVEDKQNEIVDATQLVEGYLSDSIWQNVWREKPAQFVAELKAKAQYYKEQLEKLQDKDRKLSECKSLKATEDAAKNEIFALIPERFALTLAIPEEVKDLLSELTKLYAELKSAQDRIKDAKESGSQASRKLSEFMEQHPEINDTRLSQLASYKVEAIENYRQALDKIKTKVTETKSILDDLTGRLQAHVDAKPEFAEDETTETLSAAISESDKNVAKLREQVGALKRDLEQDEANKKSRGKLIAEIETLKKEYERWSKLNNLIGDSEGQKFRKIAQSYVLGSLIRCANSYMKTLTDRYTLKVTPGTFVISLEDAYQGYVSRAATTISGGESFLVSLSLALALADIGKQLAVDTMFIDEGFGTLSGEPLRCAVDTLKSLHSTAGRHVGIISHVEELRERIPVQIQVNREGNNSSSQIQVVTL